MKGISVVVPLYNEAAKLRERAAHVWEYMRGLGRPFEIVLVDDGSRDDTRRVAEAVAAERPHVRAVSYLPNRGKGHAVRTGMLAARMELALFVDADLAIPIEHLPQFLPWVDRGYDVVIGSKKLPTTETVIPQPPLRKLLGRGYSFLSSVLFVPYVRDFTCGFKLFTRRAVDAIFPRQTMWRWAFDTEILHLAHRAGMRIKELPVRWHHDPASKVRVFRATAYSAWELVRLVARRLL